MLNVEGWESGTQHAGTSAGNRVYCQRGERRAHSEEANQAEAQADLVGGCSTDRTQVICVMAVVAALAAVLGLGASEVPHLPHLARLVAASSADPEALADEMREMAHATIAHDLGEWRVEDGFAVRNASLPVVLAHGMGDSCFNSGFKSVVAAVGKKLGVYATCIPTGDNRLMDTINGFLLNMDKSVDEFARRVRADPKLKGGFHALGLSQGNNLIRGYIQKFNDPPVHTFLSVCGINAGVAAFPQCADSIPGLGKVCLAFNEVLGELAYSSLAQSVLFQAKCARPHPPAAFSEAARTRRLTPHRRVGAVTSAIPRGSTRARTGSIRSSPS
jgi:hypothetical protein